MKFINLKTIKLPAKTIQYFMVGLQVVLTIILASTSAEQAAKSERTLYDLSVSGTVKNGRLIISPRTTSTNPGKEGYVDVNIDTGGAVINSIGMEINYRSDLIDITSMQFDRSVCNVIIEQKLNTATGNTIISCGLPNPGVNTQLGNVVTFKYKATGEGLATFNFVQSNTSMLANDGKGTDVLLYTINGSVTVTSTTANPETTPSNSPNNNSTNTNSTTNTTKTNNQTTKNNTNTTTQPSSTSTSNQTNNNTTNSTSTQAPNFTSSGIYKVPVSAQVKLLPTLGCTPQNEVRFVWLKQDGVDGFEYQLSDTLTELKDPISSQGTEVSYKIQPGKKYFFLVRAVKGSDKGPTGLATFTTCSSQDSNNLVNSMTRSFSERSYTVLYRVGEWITDFFQDLLR